MPGLTIATEPGPSNANAQNAANTQAQAPAGSSSPPRPPVSPITPTMTPAHLAPTATGSGTYYIPNFAAGRPSLTYSGADQDANARAIPPPKPEPLDFDSNPDVLALQSTISILQLQRKKALADMQRLKQTKEAALADPAAFVNDITQGRVRKQGDRQTSAAEMGDDSAEDDDDDEDGITGRTTQKPWTNLPQPQNIARMPPVNFDKYGVVGESLDKIHKEQIKQPPQGAPAVIAADGTIKPKAGQLSASGKEYRGVAAPYNPLKDELDKKPKPPKR